MYNFCQGEKNGTRMIVRHDTMTLVDQVCGLVVDYNICQEAV